MLSQKESSDSLLNLPYLCAANIKETGFNLDTIKEMAFEEDEIEAYSVEAGDLLVVEGGNVGAAQIWEGPRICIQNSLHRVKSVDGSSLGFLKYWLVYAKSCGQIDLICNKATIAHFTKEKLMNCTMVYPPKKTQVAIAKYLDNKVMLIDSVVEKAAKAIALLREYRQSIITEAVTRGLDSNAPMKPSGIEWMGNIPANWQARRVKAVVQRLNVGVVIEPSKYFDDNGTVPFLRGVNIKADGFDLSDLRYITTQSNALLKKSIVHTGDIVVVRDGAPGTALVIPPQLDGANCVSLLELTCASNIKPTYLRYALAANCSQAQFAFLSNGTAIKHLNASELGMIFVTVPPLSEQDEIIAYLDAKTAEIDALIDSKERQVELLREYRKSIISEAVTGKFKVPGLE